jgi:hypothetical protein
LKIANILSCRKVFEEYSFVPAENIKYPTSCSIRRDRSTLFIHFRKVQSAVCVLWGLSLGKAFEIANGFASGGPDSPHAIYFEMDVVM